MMKTFAPTRQSPSCLNYCQFFFFFFDSFKAYYKIGLLCLYLADALVAIQVSSLSPACLLSNLISPLKEF